MQRPNILFLFCDQLRYDAIAAHGNGVIKTPNIDRLIQQGTDFENAYSPSPVCVAARCSLHYGQYPTHTGCYCNAPMPLDGRSSYVERLTQSGYRTHSIGKCHFYPDTYGLNGYQTREFQEEMGWDNLDKETFLQQLVEKGFGYAIEPNGVRSEMYYIPQPSRLPQQLHATQWIGERTVEFLNKPQDGQPWYLFSSFIHPHPPFAPPSPWHTLYRAVDMPPATVPPEPEEFQLLINQLQNRYKYRDRGIDDFLLRTMKAYYYACVSFVDYQIGRILDTLEQTGQKENTLIIFSTDHGEMLGDYNCFGKRSLHNAAARIPLVVSGPGYAAGVNCSTPVSLVDIAPTFLKLAGADNSNMLLDGLDLADLVSGKADRKVVYSFFSAVGQITAGCQPGIFDGMDDPEKRIYASICLMAANRDYKYIYSAPDNKELLFDEKTHAEDINLANKPEYTEIKAELQQCIIDRLTRDGHTALIKDGKLTPLIRARIPDGMPDRGLIRQDYAPDFMDTGMLENYR